MRINKYRAVGNEANFGRSITTQVSAGAHITFEMITISGATFHMTRWPNGLPGHEDPPNTLRFPHGLIRWGESLDDCAARLVKAQLGMRVKSVRLAYWDAYVDDLNHWHIEPGCIVDVSGNPTLPSGASAIVKFGISSLPDMTYWPSKEFLRLVKEHLPKLIK